jgi:hypothetical protein
MKIRFLCGGFTERKDLLEYVDVDAAIVVTLLFDTMVVTKKQNKP